ncbi:MAG: tripartite tricarboxylate transporter substrate binding protein, partial [Burkholderiales bacterium]|nr:tripartite tricarboxylate transporter substrate binding protein [Burkholderiales bacterium]
TSHERNPDMPKVPTAAEVGLPGLEASDWFALFAKAGTPPARLAEWRALVAKLVASPRFVATIRGMGYGVPTAQPADFKRLLREQRDAWAGRVRLAGFKATD